MQDSGVSGWANSLTCSMLPCMTDQKLCIQSWIVANRDEFCCGKIYRLLKRHVRCPSRLIQGCKLVSLVFVAQWLDHRVQVSLHQFIKLVQCQADAMVSDTALREIVRADSLGPVSTSHQASAGFGLLLDLPFFFPGPAVGH